MRHKLGDFIGAVSRTAGTCDFEEKFSTEDLLHFAVDALMSMDRFECVLCGMDTWEAAEYYMVQHDLWDTYGAHDGMMCIGCLEGRMGRQLISADFTDAPINTDPEDSGWPRSERLRDRLAA